MIKSSTVSYRHVMSYHDKTALSFATGQNKTMTIAKSLFLYADTHDIGAK